METKYTSDTIIELKRKVEEAERNAIDVWYELGNYDKALKRVEKLRNKLAEAEAAIRKAEGGRDALD